MKHICYDLHIENYVKHIQNYVVLPIQLKITKYPSHVHKSDNKQQRKTDYFKNHIQQPIPNFHSLPVCIDGIEHSCT